MIAELGHRFGVVRRYQRLRSGIVASSLRLNENGASELTLLAISVFERQTSQKMLFEAALSNGRAELAASASAAAFNQVDTPANAIEKSVPRLASRN
jgi:hypothetical protein